ncbi:MAG: T9SS type A sorting domain-containing protein [Flavobacteriaceae bacterium]
MKKHIILLLCCCFTILGFSQSITQIEYFYNTDPGFGNATQITANANSGTLTQTLSLAVPNTLSGFNTLYVRTKDDANVWSLYNSNIFYIAEDNSGNAATNLTAAEYFINTDPGFGNADAIAINANTGSLNQTLSLPINDTNLEGFNTLYIRTQDDNGIWSLYDSKIFYISADLSGAVATNIVAAEYFINTDPGFGNADAIAVNANTGSITQTLSLPINNTLNGFNTLYIRTQDDLGVWSLYDKSLFYIYEEQIVSPIVAAEYFYDTDPGFGNGTAGTIVATGNPDEYTIDLSTLDVLPCDLHDFYIRLQNQDGSWSLYDYGTDVDVFDNADPTIVVFPNITVELDANGQATPFTIADVDNGTFDDCELVSVVLNQSQFNYTCADLGANTVTVTATDAEAKVSTLDVTVTVVDIINPVAITQDITVQLDANGTVSFVADDVDNSSTDNCSITNKSLDITSFDCSNLGVNTVTLTVLDASGNQNSSTAIITVEDSINPVAISQDITVQLDVNGNATITADDIDNLSSDNCSIDSKSLDITSFDCSGLGDNTVMLTVTDPSGNSNTIAATVTVVDSVNPTVITQDITVQLNANGTASIVVNDIENGSSDNCTISNSSLDITSFTCTDLGSNTVTLSVTDQSSNMGSATATVTVEDSINPVAISQDITVQLDINGNATITADDIDNNSTDNCVISNKSIDITSFDCSNLGANTVMLTVTDSSSNSNTISAVVTLIDNIDPTVITQNITVQLDANGTASITVNDVENGSTDNCTVSNSSLDITSFTCTDLGSNTVTLSVTDQSGNTGTQTATVTVEDSINPVAISQDITVQLDINGNATITADDIDNNSTDNCVISNKSLDITSFDCSNLGANTVMLTVTDSSSNSNTVSAAVTVVDNIDPTAIGQDITVDLADNTEVIITANDVNNGSFDNCGFTLSIDVDTFTVVGDYPVVLTITDIAGNSSSVTVTVTVEDTLGVDDFDLENQIKIYPNPTLGVFNIEIQSLKENATLEIYDILGKQIQSEILNKNTTQLDISNYANGVYFLRFISDGKVSTKRIVKK